MLLVTGAYASELLCVSFIVGTVNLSMNFDIEFNLNNNKISGIHKNESVIIQSK